MRFFLIVSDALPYLCALAFGSAVGSFLNVVIWRLPRGESIVHPGSHCPSCNAPILWFDNIPVLSYLYLRARCRSCGGRISVRYPLVEAGNALLYAGLLGWLGLTWQLPVAAVFGSAMIALALIDLDHYILPDSITLPGIAVGLATSALLRERGWLDALIGAAGGAILLLVVLGAYYLVRKVEGMGLGDVKMLAMIGAFLGWKGMLVTVILASLLGAAVGLTLVLTGWKSERAVEEGQGEGFGLALPFGTFLGAAALVSLFAGPMLVDWYAGLSGLGPE